MTFLPIVARELRAASRRRATFWIRGGAALWAIGLGSWFFLIGRHQPPHSLAQVIFGALTGSAALFSLLSGVRYTADCLSEEKREGTLGLLFLTDLKGYDVVLGKLAATSLNAVYGVLAVVPTLAIPLLLGGVAPVEFGRMALVILNTMFFSLSLGVLMSSVCRLARHASGLTLLGLLTFTGVLPAFGLWLQNLLKASRIHAAFLLPSPGTTYFFAFESTSNMFPRRFWWSLLVVHGLAWLFLLLASLIVPYTWRDRPAGSRWLPWRDRWRQWTYGAPVTRAAYRRRLLDINPGYWLAARARLRPALVWLVLGIYAAVWVWGLAKYRSRWFDPGIYLTTGIVLLGTLKFWLASEASRQLAEERQHGTLEMLLATPLSVEKILHGQGQALLRQFRWPVLFTLVVCCTFWIAGLREIRARSDSELWLCLWPAAMLILCADLVALYWVGMWKGLTAPNPQRAANATALRVLVSPWLGLALVLLLAALTPRSDVNLTALGLLALWVAFGLAADLGFGIGARHELVANFREAAARKYLPAVSLWSRLLGRSPKSHPRA